MVKQTIKIYARVRPSKKNTAVYSVNNDDQTNDSLEFLVPRDVADGFVNNKRECYRFRFQKVFDQAAKQEEIFENIAKPVADSVLAGYNGTIFAYGQTGSGKTFTITGGAERYIDRGIVPRTLSYLYERLSQDSSMVHTVHISYLEIYNETGYDLLDSRNEASQLEELPKVVIMEDPNQNIHLKNLSLLQSSNEEEALNLLFLGDTNRVIAETPMNQASTRSHCIFTVHLCRREPGSTTVRRSKLHLVDLAGSERASKTGLNGQLLTEAKYINLSLHYLEQVIIALSERNRSHIPYRNSMLTSVLRDSLGGNCMTTMIATISVDKRNLDESISTCHFAQRVAVIKNEAILNEELDPALLIARLKQENQSLKDELALLTTEQREDILTADEIQKLEEQVKQFLDDSDMDVTFLPGPDMRKIKYCFLLLKRICQGCNRGSDVQVSPAATVKGKQVPDHRMAAEMAKLKEMLLQRDNEISILVKFLKKEKQAAQEANAKLANIQNGQNLVNKSPSGAATPLLKEGSGGGRAIQYMKRGLQLSMGKKEAFEIYKRDHRGPEATEVSKNLLKKRSAEALKLGEQLKEAMSKINGMKKQLELWQRQRAARAVMGNNMEVVEEVDPVEENLRTDIKQEKKIYRDVVGHLRALRTEIEYLQLSLERSEVKLEKDFLKWWNQEASDVQESEAAAADQTGSPRGTFQPTSTATASFEAPGPSSTARPQPALSSSLTEAPRNLIPKNPTTSPPASRDQKEPDFPPPSEQRATATYTPLAPYPLTGNPQIDPDIVAFQRARDEIYHTIMNRKSTKSP